MCAFVGKRGWEIHSWLLFVCTCLLKTSDSSEEKKIVKNEKLQDISVLEEKNKDIDLIENSNQNTTFQNLPKQENNLQNSKDKKLVVSESSEKKNYNEVLNYLIQIMICNKRRQ